MSISHASATQVADILDQMRRLLPCRRGSLTEQMVAATGPDGRPRVRGPYPVYTYKDKGRTISKRVSDPAQLALYREQIERGRRFQALSAQLLRLAEAQADAHVDQAALKKTPKSTSRRSAKSPASSNG